MKGLATLLSRIELLAVHTHTLKDTIQAQTHRSVCSHIHAHRHNVCACEPQLQSPHALEPLCHN